jgi:hypothetical protein
VAAGGEVAEIASTLLALPERRLVVLGQPGSGKSVLALLLTVDLLERRRSDVGLPVPLLLSVSSWQPAEEALWAWVARRLAEDYPGLAGAHRPSVEQLAGDGKLLVVLDGLDEIPTDLHVAAIEALDEATAGGVPFVLTCRVQEFEAAVATGGRALSAAAVVDVQPVDLAAAASFLSQSGPAGADRWRPILAELDDDTDTPLGRALSTPLVVWLARTVYTDPRTDPGELADQVRFPNATSVEDYLLASYLPAVYRPKAGSDSRYRPEQAGRWLGRIASDLSENGTYDLAWWKLLARRRVPPVIFALLVGVYMATAAVELGGSVSLLISNYFISGVGCTVMSARLNLWAASRLAFLHQPARLWWQWLTRIGVGVTTGVAFGVGFISAGLFADLLLGSAPVGNPTFVQVLGVQGGGVGLAIGLVAGIVSTFAVPYRARPSSRRRSAIRARLVTTIMIVPALWAAFFIHSFAERHFFGRFPLGDPDFKGLRLSELALAALPLLMYGIIARLLVPRGAPHRLIIRIGGRGKHIRRMLLVGASFGPAIGAEILILIVAPGIFAYDSPGYLAEDFGIAAMWGAGFGIAIGISTGIARALLDPAETARAASPRRLLRQDRTAVLFAAAIAAITTVLAMNEPRLIALLAGVSSGLADLPLGSAVLYYGVSGIVVAVGFVTARFPWAGFVVTRYKLALTGRLPWRLMTFLDDAWRRGVLRQAGGVYQFRHAHVQDYLAREFRSRHGGLVTASGVNGSFRANVRLDAGAY